MKSTKPELYQAPRAEAIAAATDMEQKLDSGSPRISKPDFDRAKGKINPVSMSPDALQDVIAYLLSPASKPSAREFASQSSPLVQCALE